MERPEGTLIAEGFDAWRDDDIESAPSYAITWIRGPVIPYLLLATIVPWQST